MSIRTRSKGSPLSAALCTAVTAFAPGVIDRLGGKPPAYAQSHQNDPLGAAVVREVVRFIRDEGLVERGRETADLLLAGLKEIAARTGLIREIRARGLMLAIDLKDDDEVSLGLGSGSRTWLSYRCLLA